MLHVVNFLSSIVLIIVRLYPEPPSKPYMKNLLKSSKNHLLCSLMYRKIGRRGKKNIQKKNKGSVVINISDPALYHRYFYTLIKFFSIEGYAVYYPACDLVEFRKKFFRKNAQPWNFFNLIFDEGLVILGEMPADKDFIELNDDNISPDYYFLAQERKEHFFRIPMTMHPLFYHMEHWQTPVKMVKKRKSTVFFSGNLDPGPYQKFKRGIFQQENRADICRHLRLKPFYKNIKTEESLQEFIRGEEDFRVIMINTHEMDIYMPGLRSVLNEFNFFLALPGVFIPHSHNLIEALSVSMIPVIHENYASRMTPPFVHLENAILFENLEDLDEKINIAFKMDEEQINKMRKSVQDYYTENLTPHSVIKKIFSNKEKLFFLQAEQNSVKEIL